LADVEVLEEGHGVYYGLTADRDRAWVVSRNLDPLHAVRAPGRPTNALQEFSRSGCRFVGPAWNLPEFEDLHQIRFHDGLLWLVNGRSPELLAVDPDRRCLVGGVPLARLVPFLFQHEAPAHRPDDIFHFNSLHFSGGRLWVLAHNWHLGSFALELDYPGARSLLARPRLLTFYAGLGEQSHDIFWDRHCLYVLDSGRGRVLVRGAPPVPVGAPGRPFLRGLAVSRGHLFVGYGLHSEERTARSAGPTRLAVLDRDTLALLADVEIGRFGNSCALLLLDPPDECDRSPLRRPSVWQRCREFLGGVQASEDSWKCRETAVR
jgi:hypothetical protein